MAKKKEITIRSSAAEYLSYIASVGEQPLSVELRYEDENIWLTQRLMAELYGVTVAAISQHLKTIFKDGELSPQKWQKSMRRPNGRSSASLKIVFIKAILTDSFCLKRNPPSMAKRTNYIC